MKRLALLCLRWPRLGGLAFVASTLVLAAGLPRLETEAGYRAFLGAEHPVIVELDAFAARFGGGLPFAAVWSCRVSSACTSALEAESLAMAYRVATALERTPGVARVDSPATTPLLVRPAIGLPGARVLAPDGLAAPDLAALAPQALADPAWRGQLVSPDGSAGALIIQLSSSDSALGANAYRVLERALAPEEARGFVFDRVGGPVEFVVAGGELANATAQLIPVMVALTGAVLLLLLRRAAPAAIALGCVGIAVVWTLGLLGWLGWPQNSLTQVLAPLVLVIGVCDTIHLITAYAQRLSLIGDDADADGALEQAISVVARPCLFTTLTTAAGFLSFASSGLEAFVRFGVIAAWGVCAALVVTFGVAPLALSRLPAHRVRSARPGTPHSVDQLLRRVARPSRAAAHAVLVGTLLIAGCTALGLPRLVVDASFEELYGENSRVVRWVRGAAEHLRHAETLEIAIEFPAGTPASSAGALAVLERVEALQHHALLGPALSILDPIRAAESFAAKQEPVFEAANAEQRADDARNGGANDAAERAARRARAYRLVRGEAPGFTSLFVDEPGRALRLSLQAPKSAAPELRRVLADVDRSLDAALPAGATAIVTGPLATVAAMIDEIRSTQLRSFGVAGALVFALILVFFRSPLLAGMALVPTVLPVVATLGAMGWLAIPLDVGTAMVAAVVLGLAIDDAIHLLDAYADERARRESAGDALAAAIERVGRALVTTSFALAVGFSALALSPWNTVASFGAVTAIAVAAALLADLVVLPALVVALSRRDSSGAASPGRA